MRSESESQFTWRSAITGKIGSPVTIRQPHGAVIDRYTQPCGAQKFHPAVFNAM
jgi:hypothetical protein